MAVDAEVARVMAADKAAPRRSVVFLITTAEEKGLLLLGNHLYDEHYAVSTLREQLLRPLVGFNFGWDRPVPWFRFKYEEEQDLKALSEVYRNLAAMGVPLDMEHVAERFGIPLVRAGGTGS